MGKEQESVSDKEFLRLFAMSPDPILTAKEISEHLPISNQAVNKRLKRLENEEILTSKKVGSSARVYWLTADGRSELAKLEFGVED